MDNNPNNLPSTSNESQNSQTSSLVSAERISSAIQRFGDDYVNLVFNKYQQPPISIELAAASHAPSLNQISAFFTRDASLLWLRFHIAEVFAFLGLFDTISKAQIKQTAELILNHELYGTLNCDELLLFFKKFKTGEFGKIYQSARPNPQEMLVCLKPFWQDLIEHRMRVAREEEEEKRRKREAEERDSLMTREQYNEYLKSKSVQDGSPVLSNPPKP